MEVTIKGQQKTVTVGTKVRLDDGSIGIVTMDIGKSVIVKDDTGDFQVVEPARIVDIVVMVIKELGLIDRFIAWLKRKLTPSK